MRVTVIGAGYAGLVTAACLASLDHDVVLLDNDPVKIAGLVAGSSPVFEPGLDDLLAVQQLRFSDSYGDAIPGADVVLIVVGTPVGEGGAADLSAVEAAVDEMAPLLPPAATVVVKSTVPVGTTRLVGDRLGRLRPDASIDVVANPEFLRQGSAVKDFLEPDRVVIGVERPVARAAMEDLYQGLLDQGVPVVWTNPESAELIKYAANAFLATKLAFINEMADLAEAAGADIEDVAAGLGLDPRIGTAFLKPGPGFGGACLPKDTQALLSATEGHGIPSLVVAAALAANRDRIARITDRIEAALGGSLTGRAVAVLGITFKPGTDDVRGSPALAIVQTLIARGAEVTIFDPKGMDHAREILGDGPGYAADEYAAATGADVLVIATEWERFASLSLDRLRTAMASPLVMDVRNLLDQATMAAAGFRYLSLGRPA